MPNKTNRKVVYVFQGGGAFGSYQLGVYQALKEKGFSPNSIVGISIGAINAAIIAGNKPENRLKQLETFWEKVTTLVPFSNLFYNVDTQIKNWIGAQSALWCGQPGFFNPKLWPSAFSSYKTEELSYYDTSPLKDTLNELIDFDYLNEKHIRLSLCSVDLASGDFKIFDSFTETINVEHVMASGAMPPGFPPIEIDGHFYVDGGLYSNTPIISTLDRILGCKIDSRDVLCFMVDLFPAKGALPTNMNALAERVKDIQFASRTSRARYLYSASKDLCAAISYLTTFLSEDEKKDPKVQEIIKLGHLNSLDIVHLIYHSQKSELESKDYNFSKQNYHNHRNNGYNNTIEIYKQDGKDWAKNETENKLNIFTLADPEKSDLKELTYEH
ncbi:MULTISPECIES: patatin-like phospholipase family protein [unclassified Photobacterium]|uniref:patatin-like phospholipase family protein n=1 Tax=unclassified Photobacterium TaxID=2628852 RepID=UPI001EDF5D3C|nr:MULTISPECIES: patatin-like phospholipase family protein [unclassified Photobacterium]MCG3863566.1 patatin-like phospholipase family protein [Photobacterium sp. Ph6]MCG3875095.1 patatin-like phospholipase family protein [Photobacterium sp. Ph5]